MHNLNHNRVLHERVLFLTVKMKEVPWVPTSECTTVEPLGQDCYRIVLRFGFMDQPDVPKALATVGRISGRDFDLMERRSS